MNVRGKPTKPASPARNGENQKEERRETNISHRILRLLGTNNAVVFSSLVCRVFLWSLESINRGVFLVRARGAADPTAIKVAYVQEISEKGHRSREDGFVIELRLFVTRLR